ncbi:MAG: helix-turn-helix transcriptional regulator [bacterium]|nr:helix-turn-helix transcriptional regulator [bacterium]MDI1335296.1 helix-turn-helix transcriptional regulator [Lacunisphaera sp.]
MVAEKHPPLVPASYLAGATCLLPGRGNELLGQLTPAERLVAAHVAQGLSNKEISSALNRAEPTIKHQIASACRKFGVQSRCRLIVLLLT